MKLDGKLNKWPDDAGASCILVSSKLCAERSAIEYLLHLLQSIKEREVSQCKFILGIKGPFVNGLHKYRQTEIPVLLNRDLQASWNVATLKITTLGVPWRRPIVA